MELDNLIFDENLTDSISQFIKENGVNTLEKFTENHLNQWKNCPLNIAITGNSGVGKSTLINTFRSLRPYDIGAAPVNVIECTQIDIDIDNQLNEFNEQDFLVKIRNNCLLNLNNISTTIYLISGLLHNTSHWDFSQLFNDLIENFPLVKRQAFILAMSPIGNEIIRAKINELKKRIWIVATSSAIISIIPVPFISVGFDLTACIRETTIYRQQLGLTEIVLRQLSESHHIPYERFSMVLQDKIPIEMITNIGNFVLSVAKSIILTLGTQETSRYIPIVGTAIASTVSFSSTMYILNNILNDMEKAALDIQKILFECSSNFD